MSPRRQQTRLPSEQPVRFYQLIALTFLLLTILLLGLVVFMSSKRATIVIESATSPVDVTATIEAGSAPDMVSGRVASVQVNVRESFAPTSRRAEPAVATGTVTLYNDGEEGQPLVWTTRLLTGDGALFRLKRRTVVPAGGTVEAEVYADEAGDKGNIGPTRFTIPGLRSDKQKTIYAMSNAPMSGGVKLVGIFGADDLKRAKKVLVDRLRQAGEDQLKQKQPNQTAVFIVAQEVSESGEELGAEVDRFSLSGTATVIGVFYDQEALVRRGREYLSSRAVDDTEIIEPGVEPPSVRVVSHDAAAGTAKLEVVYRGAARLNPESRQLDKAIFFGKSKDEIRRYVLRLDHVRGVDVKFTPIWTQTVPHIAEHVSVVVKSVE